jgi:mono/diheme cytochrome c family protein
MKTGFTYALAWGAVVLFPFIVLGAMWALRRDPQQPNWMLPTQMRVNSAYQSQTANPVLPGGMTMQPPVEGTLAREAHPFRYANTDADRQRAGRELVNPFASAPDRLARGKQAYETYCAVCHGAQGRGDGPLIPKYPNPPNFAGAASLQLRDGELFHIITYGRNKMAGYAAQLPWEERWHVIQYIRSLQKGGR